jgi:hypothetical protein
VTVVNSTAFTLQGSTGNATYTSGGFVVKLDSDAFLSDIPSGARSVSRRGRTSKTWTPGATGVIFDSADTTFTAWRRSRRRSRRRRGRCSRTRARGDEPVCPGL